MANAPLPWSLKGVSRAARDAARAAAKREGVPLGVWLSRVIRDISAAEHGEAAPGAETQNDPAMNSIERAVARSGLQTADPPPR
jgi:hypothetical protein